jgi:predicted enzyme related to lactoylglutathione lyase
LLYAPRMRRRLLTLATLVALVGSSALHADTANPRPDLGAGRVAWFDLTTTSIAKSEAFYAKLFDWKFNPIAGTDLAVSIVAGGTEVGSLRVAEGAISPFDGVVYIQVSDLNASCKKATALGGKIPPGFPFDLPGGKGAIAILADPSGHPIGMYSRAPLHAAK